jgi:hypothetical protein
MDFDAFVLFNSQTDTPADALRMAVDRMIEYGWGGIVLTRNATSIKQVPPSPSPVPLSGVA